MPFPHRCIMTHTHAYHKSKQYKYIKNSHVLHGYTYLCISSKQFINIHENRQLKYTSQKSLPGCRSETAVFNYIFNGFRNQNHPGSRIPYVGPASRIFLLHFREPFHSATSCPIHMHIFHAPIKLNMPATANYHHNTHHTHFAKNDPWIL